MSYESRGLDHFSCVTTTGHVIWLDDRYPRRPLLGFKHHRGRDMTLGTLSIQLQTGWSILDQIGQSLLNLLGLTSLLTSRKNGLVTVYDVNRGTDNLVHCNSPPICLPWDKPMFTKCTGHAVVASPCGSAMSLLRLTAQGSIHRQDIRVFTGLQAKSQPASEDALAYEWDANVQNLDEKAKDLSPLFGLGLGRYFTELDLRAPYESE